MESDSTPRRWVPACRKCWNEVKGSSVVLKVRYEMRNPEYPTRSTRAVMCVVRVRIRLETERTAGSGWARI
jgi:hypothetical protein